MRAFYGSTLGFPLQRELSSSQVEFRVGSNILALTERGGRFNDPSPPLGTLSLQLAFRVAPNEVASCAATLIERGGESHLRSHRSFLWPPHVVLP